MAVLSNHKLLHKCGYMAYRETAPNILFLALEELGTGRIGLRQH